MAFLLSLNGTFCNCNFEKRHLGFERNHGTYKVKKIGRLPKTLLENSALEIADSGEYWTLQDSGGAPLLFRVNGTGELLDTLMIPGLINKDWEELAQDSIGHLFIGDIGNNLNQRKDLGIYKLHLPSNNIGLLKIQYEDQTLFPPKREEMNYDCEAYFWLDGKLHLFSKNRGIKKVKHYEVPDQPGTYSLSAKDELTLKGKITAADVSPDGQLMALLSYGKMWLFKIENVSDLWSKPFKCVKVNRGQTEGLVFVNNTDILISNETGGLYLVTQDAERE
ncbi:MAG: hypothetical protein ACR2MX_15705 [Cyclobacteriaceae bacterium]